MAQINAGHGVLRGVSKRETLNRNLLSVSDNKYQ